MIQAHALEKSFGEFKAVNKIDLKIRKGECFGLLGPNGAGKSTFINMIYGTSKDLAMYFLLKTFQKESFRK